MLDLSYNNINSTLPAEWGDLVNSADEVHLQGNNLYGTIPREWGLDDQQCSEIHNCNVRKIDFSDNYCLCGVIPEGVIRDAELGVTGTQFGTSCHQVSTPCAEPGHPQEDPSTEVLLPRNPQITLR